MKKLLLKSTLVCLTLLGSSSCVDKTYDIGNISDSDLTIGGDISMPLAKIDIPLGDILDFAPLNGSVSRAIQSINVPATFSDSFDINTGFDISKYIGKTGEITLRGSVTSPLPFGTKVWVGFISPDGQVKTIINDQEITALPAVTTINAVTLTIEDIEFIANAKRIDIKFETADGLAHNVILDPKQVIKIHLSILKKGGIKI